MIIPILQDSIPIYVINSISSFFLFLPLFLIFSSRRIFFFSPSPSFAMGSATLRESPTLQFDVFVPLSGPVLFWSRAPSSWPPRGRPRGLSPSRTTSPPRSLLQAKTVLFFVARTASSGSVHVDSFLPRPRRSPQGCEGGIRSHTVETLKHALCLTLCATALLSAKAALPTKRDFNYRAMGFASGSRETYGQVYIPRCRR